MIRGGTASPGQWREIYLKAVPLNVSDFEGFNAAAAQRCLKSFDTRTRKRGEAYFNNGAVESLTCEEPGRVFNATVRGGHTYEVALVSDDGLWDATCTCPVEYECKHAYAALKQLLAEHSGATVAELSASPGDQKLVQRTRAKLAATQFSEFGQTVLAKLGRAPTPDEARWLKTIARLHQRAQTQRFLYEQDFAPFGVAQPRLTYYQAFYFPAKFPANEAEFWNLVAFHLVEKHQVKLPIFLEPFTDFAELREQQRHAARKAEIDRWSQTLGQLENYSTPRMAGEATPLELRVRLLREKIVFETRASPAEKWLPVKSGKLRDFDSNVAVRLAPEAALLWLPFSQRAAAGYSVNLHYRDAQTAAQVGRWFRSPPLRPLLADESGAPLVFHAAPLRWEIAPPENADGDYVFSLVQANGEKLPEVFLTADAGQVFYLTPLGVFTGPPFEAQVMSGTNATHIPAKAFESVGGLRLIERLRAEPPPRLAALVQTVKMRPLVRAELKAFAPGYPEICRVQLLAGSDDGNFSEHWTFGGWADTDNSFGRLQKKSKQLLRYDRAAVDGLVPPLEAAGFKWELHHQAWTLKLSKKFAEVFVTFLQALPADARIELRGELASFQNAEVAGKIRLEASEDGMDWFNLRVLVDVNDATLTPEEIKLLLDAKGNWVRLDKKGWRKLQFSLSPEEDQELARLGLTPHELTSAPQRLHALQLADKAAKKFLPAETFERIERRVSELKARVTPDVPAEIQAELRPYQRDGFHFLAYLSENRFGGILADDMGLGKTLQTLAWLAWLRAAERGVHAASTSDDADASKNSGVTDSTTLKRPEGRAPSLVVCPKSVADNWQAEAAKFFPSLKVRVWSASELKSFAGMLASADLHVLNYSQLRLVGEALAREKFHAVILDEGQYIKNPTSQTAQIARQLRSEHRLILSGTPIENRLLDLWSLMSFAMPGVLGNRAEFGRLYDAKGDPFARQRLAARVRPFLIRRTKAQVARDLPDRMEEDLFCELEGEQKTLYRAELKRAQAMLLGVKTAAALNQQRFNFLTSLLRLRQICCHPKLVKPDSKAASAKLEALMETLDPLMEEGQKVLVFSQFVELLGLVRTEIKKRDWPHWYLAGDTENRGDLVKKFQAAEGGGVFLISLKAGGFGLNLTAASYVVLFDPWWNPAVENQAIDRTHRIGQTQKVMAYRLLIKDSIEEKIRALQKQKSSLANDVFGEEKFSQGLSLDDLRYLLAG